MKKDLIYDDYKKYETSKSEREKFASGLKMFGDAYCHEFSFKNGYGASVVKHFGSHGYYKDLFELAVLKKMDNGDYELCFDTPITDDVIGYLTNDEVLDLLEKIKNLERVK